MLGETYVQEVDKPRLEGVSGPLIFLLAHLTMDIGKKNLTLAVEKQLLGI